MTCLVLLNSIIHRMQSSWSLAVGHPCKQLCHKSSGTWRDCTLRGHSPTSLPHNLSYLPPIASDLCRSRVTWRIFLDYFTKQELGRMLWFEGRTAREEVHVGAVSRQFTLMEMFPLHLGFGDQRLSTRHTASFRLGLNFLFRAGQKRVNQSPVSRILP